VPGEDKFNESNQIGKNKALVLKACDTLFQQTIAPGREGLFDLIKSLPSTLKYEPGRLWRTEIS
jgi:hypothetical protein